jgi:hypothetical protein
LAKAVNGDRGPFSLFFWGRVRGSRKHGQTRFLQRERWAALPNIPYKGITLNEQENRWWSVKVQNFKSKEYFLRYAGRYLRRPPIAQRRITDVAERNVSFWYKDKKLGRKVSLQCSPEEFIERWSQHIPERYRHAVRNFGLFAPRDMRQTFDAVFAVLGQQRGLRPKPRPWAESIKRDFGRDPLRASPASPARSTIALSC